MAYVSIHDPFERLCSGSLLVRCDVQLPESMRLVASLTIRRWRLIPRLHGAELERKLNQEGRYFFYVPPEIRTSAFGLDRKHALARALKKLLLRAEIEKLNAMEITAAGTKNFLGIHYANVGARLRHIQKSLILFETSEEPCPQTVSVAA